MTKDQAKEVQDSLLKMRQAEGELILFARADVLEKYLFTLYSHRDLIKKVTQEHFAERRDRGDLD